MAVKYFYIGSHGPFFYEDTDPIDDPDSNFPGGTTQDALTGDGIANIGGLSTEGTVSAGVFKILDTGGDHTLRIKPNEDLSADRVLNIIVTDGDKTITLTGNPTLNDWFDQAVKAASSPTFANPRVTTIELGHASDTTLKRDESGVVSIEDDVIILVSKLISTSNALGASLVGIEDSMALFSATDVEAALEEVMDMITIVTTTADSLTETVSQGITGNVAGTQTINDGNELDIAEVSGGPNPNFVIDFDFSGIVSGHEPNLIELHYAYSGSHTISIQMWNYTGTPQWDVIDNTTITNTGGVLTFESIVITGTITDYVSGGAVQVRFSHDQNGVVTDVFTIDYLAIKDDHGIGSGITDHGALSGLGDDDHTQYIKDVEFTQNSGILVGTSAGAFQEEAGGTLRTSLGLAIGTNVLAYKTDEELINSLSGDASAAFNWNDQLLTSIKGVAINSGVITDDTYENPLSIFLRTITTINLACSHPAITAYCYPTVEAGATQSNYAAGTLYEVLRNYYEADTDDDGTLNQLFGFRIGFGHLDTNPGADPQTVDIYGCYLKPYYKTGDITNLYSLYLASAVTGGTVVNEWGIYQADDADNYLGGNLKSNKDIEGVNVIGSTALKGGKLVLNGAGTTPSENSVYGLGKSIISINASGGTDKARCTITLKATGNGTRNYFYAKFIIRVGYLDESTFSRLASLYQVICAQFDDGAANEHYFNVIELCAAGPTGGWTKPGVGNITHLSSDATSFIFDIENAGASDVDVDYQLVESHNVSDYALTEV